MTGTVVIGVGNPFRRDDGVGPAVVQMLRDRDPDAHLITCDGEPTRLIDLWSAARLAIVIDAVRAEHGWVGRIYRLSARHPTPTRSGIAASHAADLGDAVALARALDLMPGTLLLYAVQVDDVRPGVGLSPAVEATARRLADEIATLIAHRTAITPEVP
jgi:hydrogenase maturation protease